MSEVQGEQETGQYDEFRAIIDNAVGGSFPALRNYDTARYELYKDLSLLTANDMSLEVAKKMDVDGVSVQFGVFLGYLLDERESKEEFIETAVYIMTTDGYDRISLIQKALDDECAGLENDPAEMIKGFNELARNLDTYEELIEYMVKFYDNDIKADINHLIEGLADEENISLDDSDEALPISTEDRREIRVNVRNLSKIAGGLALAAVLGKILRRSR